MKTSTKIFLIAVSALIVFHISFIFSKRYSCDLAYPANFKKITQKQYENVINQYSGYSGRTFLLKSMIIKNTKINYLFGLPEKTIYFIYSGYFLLFAAFILSFEGFINKNNKNAYKENPRRSEFPSSKNNKMPTESNDESINKQHIFSKKKNNSIFYWVGLLIIVCLGLGLFLILKPNSNNRKSKHPGFEKTEDGLYYKFYHKSKDTTKARLAEYAEVEMIYGSPDSVLFDSRTLPAARRPMKIPIIKSIYKGDIYEGLGMMHVGDSAIFQCNADSVFKKLFRMRKLPKFVDSTKDIYFAIKLVGVVTPQQMQAEESARMVKLKNAESKELEAYLKKDNITVKPTKDGLYFIPEKRGKGSHPKTGEMVFVEYTGYLLNGQKFDSSIDRGKPFKFTLGRHQVISGWDEGIAMLRKGGSATLIIPSSLGYGARNMGPVPPFSTLVFDVKLVDIQNPN